MRLSQSWQSPHLNSILKVDFKAVDLAGFLEYKTLYYDKIDFTIVQRSWEILKPHLQLPFVIHIVGTNGKGTTGRFLATYLNRINKDVLHYSSPHIKNFNERIWINGEDVLDEALESAHQIIQKILLVELLEKLTYFEYTTLLALVCASNRDYLVLEAGLGGEFDATNIVTNDLSLITTIDLDHQAFLGDTIEAIAKTKMRSVDTKMIVGYQKNDEVYAHAEQIAQQREVKLETLGDYPTQIEMLDLPLPTYLKQNLRLSIAALQSCGIAVDFSLFKDVTFQGRCQKISPNITIDVGHNPLAAQAIVEEMAGKRVNLYYNSFDDKDYESVLKILKPIIKSIIIVPIDDKRVVNEEKLIKVCGKLNIILNQNKEVFKAEECLVFGSFLVVEKFLELYADYEINEK